MSWEICDLFANGNQDSIDEGVIFHDEDKFWNKIFQILCPNSLSNELIIATPDCNHLNHCCEHNSSEYAPTKRHFNDIWRCPTAVEIMILWFKVKAVWYVTKYRLWIRNKDFRFGMNCQIWASKKIAIDGVDITRKHWISQISVHFHEWFDAKLRQLTSRLWNLWKKICSARLFRTSYFAKLGHSSRLLSQMFMGQWLRDSWFRDSVTQICV
jgi:hypothetical protein